MTIYSALYSKSSNPYLHDVEEKDTYDFEEPECISKESIVVIKNATYLVTMLRAA